MLEEILELTRLNVRSKKQRPEIPLEFIYELVRGIERMIETSEFVDPECLKYIERPSSCSANSPVIRKYTNWHCVLESEWKC